MKRCTAEAVDTRPREFSPAWLLSGMQSLHNIRKEKESLAEVRTRCAALQYCERQVRSKGHTILPELLVSAQVKANLTKQDITDLTNDPNLLLPLARYARLNARVLTQIHQGRNESRAQRKL